MRTNLIKTSLFMFFFSVITLTSAYAGSFTQKDSTGNKSKKHVKVDKCEAGASCKDAASCKDMDKCTDDKDMDMGKAMKTDSKKAVSEKAKKVINLKAIDKNKDGKVYQCPMDFDVLSDKAGKDPKCGMALKEVTLEQAKKSLADHGFQVK